MKIIIVSDSHSLKKPLDTILEKHKDADLFLHCGDICLDPSLYPQFQVVCGNNDYYDLPLEQKIRLKNSKHHLLMMHSHLMPFHNRIKAIVKKAKQQDSDIVCFGHTHCAFYEFIDGVHVLNPGSVYMSRDGKSPSYAELNIDKDDSVQIKFYFLK